MNIFKATASFEGWLRGKIPVVRADLQAKHALMAEDAFRFFRGTFYRWAQLWPKHGKKMANAPSVLAVGDLHVNSFGTWRDKLGRLVWGVDDFDEAFFLPYTNDRVRLATSARLAYSLGHLLTSTKNACEAILDGYGDSVCVWASQGKNRNTIYYPRIMENSVRCADPYVRVKENWRVSRLSPDSSPVEIESLPRKREEDAMMNKMGWEAANIHLGSKRSVKLIQHDLQKRRGNWLKVAAKQMARVLSKDWK